MRRALIGCFSTTWSQAEERLRNAAADSEDCGYIAELGARGEVRLLQAALPVWLAEVVCGRLADAARLVGVERLAGLVRKCACQPIMTDHAGGKLAWRDPLSGLAPPCMR